MSSVPHESRFVPCCSRGCSSSNSKRTRQPFSAYYLSLSRSLCYDAVTSKQRGLAFRLFSAQASRGASKAPLAAMCVRKMASFHATIFSRILLPFHLLFPCCHPTEKTRKTSQILPEHSIDRAAKSIRYQKLYSSGSTNKTNLICISPMSVLDNPPAGTHAPPPPPSYLIAFPLQTHRASYRHTLHNFRLNRAHQEHATYFF